ncbi:MAG TPA: hypothetical protein VFN10_12140 [Thermoanaerobaculia bacterium]|nr:hypothetical protein [Thermoanaerobaculia bacterium]
MAAVAPRGFGTQAPALQLSQTDVLQGRQVAQGDGVGAVNHCVIEQLRGQ